MRNDVYEILKKKKYARKWSDQNVLEINFHGPIVANTNKISSDLSRNDSRKQIRPDNRRNFILPSQNKAYIPFEVSTVNEYCDKR